METTNNEELIALKKEKMHVELEYLHSKLTPDMEIGLVIEDTNQYATEAKKLDETKDFAILVAKNLKEARDYLESYKFSWILSDVHFPSDFGNKDALDQTKAVLDLCLEYGLPICFVTKITNNLKNGDHTSIILEDGIILPTGHLPIGEHTLLLPLNDAQTLSLFFTYWNIKQAEKKPKEERILDSFNKLLSFLLYEKRPKDKQLSEDIVIKCRLILSLLRQEKDMNGIIEITEPKIIEGGIKTLDKYKEALQMLKENNNSREISYKEKLNQVRERGHTIKLNADTGFPEFIKK